METVFPEGDGFAGFFMVGFRKNPDPPGETQRVGTVILKRTYDIQSDPDPALGSLTPAKKPLPVFEQDVPDNLALNGNMEASQVSFGEGDDETLPGAWQAGTGATISLAPNEGFAGVEDTALRVTGTANSQVVQTISLDEPLGGRLFSLSGYAKADADATVNSIRLEADGTTICAVNRALIGDYRRFTDSGVCPESVEGKEMQVVLPMATDATCTVFYDNVEVLERGYKTKVDVAALRYESDLMPFKPQGDVAVLDYADQAGLNRVRVNGSVWLERSVSLTGDGQDKALFGWEPRAGDTRKDEANFPPQDSEYPLPGPLPDGFNNLFYNGYDRQARADGNLGKLPYFLPGDQVRIQRSGGSDDYAFTLGSEDVTAQFHYYRGSGADDERCWCTQPVAINLDTLVIEPEIDRCYAVWRGVWDFDEHPDDVYRRLTVSVAEP